MRPAGGITPTSYSFPMRASRRTKPRSSSSSAIRIRSAIASSRYLGGQGGRRGGGSHRQLDDERGLRHTVAQHLDAPVMGVDDLLGDRQAEAGPLRLGGEE